jgi:hypothetical protein
MNLLSLPIRLAFIGLLASILMVGTVSYSGLIMLNQKLDPSQIKWGGSNAYIYNLGAIKTVRWHLFINKTDGDNAVGDFQKSLDSTIKLLENDKVLGPPHSLETNIRRDGGGAFSHCIRGSDGWIIFSTSDNSDPRINGRHYRVNYLVEMDSNIFQFVLALFCFLFLVEGTRALWPSLCKVAFMIWRLCRVVRGKKALFYVIMTTISISFLALLLKGIDLYIDSTTNHAGGMRSLFFEGDLEKDTMRSFDLYPYTGFHIQENLHETGPQM